MKIAFIGDIVGRPARRIIKEKLKTIKDKYNIDFVIANGENVSHGFGITVKNANELFSYGVDLITGGNHIWDKHKDIIALLNDGFVLRPNNYPEEVAGTGLKIVKISNWKLAIINLMGLVSMPQVLNPFTQAISTIEELNKNNMKNTWSVLKQAIGKQNDKYNWPQTFKIDNKYILGETGKTNILNKQNIFGNYRTRSSH